MSFRTPAALALALVLALAGCSGDDPEDEPGAAPAPGWVSPSPAPDVDSVADEVKEGARLRRRPDGLIPDLYFVARDSSLTAVEQSCVLGYLATSRETPCLLGHPEAGRVVVLWGDGRAAQWIPAVDQVAKTYGWQLRVLVKYGCPPLLGVTPWLEAEDRPYGECEEFNRLALEEVERTAEVAPTVVMLAGGVRGTSLVVDGQRVPMGRPLPGNGWRADPAGDEEWQAALGRTLEGLDLDGVRSLVVGDTPYPGHDAQTCLLAHPRDLRRCAAPRRRALETRHNDGLARTAEEHDAEYVDPTPWLCTGRTCPAVVAGRVVYRDVWQVGRHYAAYLSTVLGRAAHLDE
jgi:hypothetical protein